MRAAGHPRMDPLMISTVGAVRQPWGLLNCFFETETQRTSPWAGRTCAPRARLTRAKTRSPIAGQSVSSSFDLIGRHVAGFRVQVPVLRSLRGRSGQPLSIGAGVLPDSEPCPLTLVARPQLVRRVLDDHRDLAGFRPDFAVQRANRGPHRENSIRGRTAMSSTADGGRYGTPGVTENLVSDRKPGEDHVEVGRAVRKFKRDLDLIFGRAEKLAADVAQHCADESPVGVTLVVCARAAIFDVGVFRDKTVCGGDEPELIRVGNIEFKTVAHRTSMSGFSEQSGATRRMLAVTERSLRSSLEDARRDAQGMSTISLPATAIDGLLGMLQDPSTPEFWYRRRQFIVFFGMTGERPASSSGHAAFDSGS